MTARRRSSRMASLVRWWPRVDRSTLRVDAAAGLVGALIALPQAVAFATLAGVPAEYGLYCAIVPTIVAALFGSSLHTVTGPTNALSLMTFAALVPLAAPGSAEYVRLAATLAFVSGLFMLALGVLRLGSMVNFVSQPVIVGFTAGAGILILMSQLGPLTGIDVPRHESSIGTSWQVLSNLDRIRPAVLLVAAVTIVCGWAMRRWRPGSPNIVVALVAGVAVAHLANLVFGAERTGIGMLDAIPRSLPPLSFPSLDLGTLGQLSGVAVAVTIVSLTQSVSIAKAIALRTGQRIDGNREFVGQGLANLSAGLFSGFPVGASVNRSGQNLDAGAVTPMAAVFTGLLLAVIALVFAPLVAWLPRAVVAGVLCLAGAALIDVARIRATLRTSRPEGGVLLATFVATLLMRLEVAVLIGVAAALVLYLSRTSRPTMRSLVPDALTRERPFVPVDPQRRECPQAKLLSIEGSIYFGAVDHVAAHFETLREFVPAQKHLVLLMRNVNFIDVAGVDLLVSEAARRREAGGALYLHGLRPGVEAFLERADAMERIGRDRIYSAKHVAIADLFSRLDPAICRRCTARIFYECQQYSED